MSESVVIELSGPDCSGKSSLSLAIDKHYEDIGKAPVYAHKVVLDRGVYDFSILDHYFNRQDDDAVKDRIDFLIKNADRYKVIYLTASIEDLNKRQDVKIRQGLLDGSDYNRKVIDMERMSKMYEAFYEAYGKKLQIFRFNTSYMSLDKIVEELADAGVID